MNIRFLLRCCVLLVMYSLIQGFPLQQDDNIASPQMDLWQQVESNREKRLWRDWDEDQLYKREWLAQNLANNIYKRLWRNWSGEDEKEANIKRLWRSQENTNDDTLCVPCADRCRRSSDKMRPSGGKTLPCCNC